MTHEEKVALLKSRYAIVYERIKGYPLIIIKPRLNIQDNRAIVMMDTDNGHRVNFKSIAECSAVTGRPKEIIYKFLKKRLKNQARYRFSYA